uniref:Uncharacterized protein n=1 Tax=Plectus sambesii TaxID=2011161 RepID=A0A914WE20_9BILA
MILNGKGQLKRKGFVYNINTKGSAIRDGRYKLILGNPGIPSGWIPPYMESRDGPPIQQSTWLFDLKNDPFERRDLSRWKAHVVRRLRKKVFELAKKSVPNIHRRIDNRGNPDNFGGVYASGWC